MFRQSIAEEKLIVICVLAWLPACLLACQTNCSNARQVFRQMTSPNQAPTLIKLCCALCGIAFFAASVSMVNVDQWHHCPCVCSKTMCSLCADSWGGCSARSGAEDVCCNSKLATPVPPKPANKKKQSTQKHKAPSPPSPLTLIGRRRGYEVARKSFF